MLFLPYSLLTLSTQDTGCGIKVSQQGMLFRIVEQENDVAKKERHRLGLQIAHQIALALEGELSLVESSPAGSQFCLTFPYRNVFILGDEDEDEEDEDEDENEEDEE